jgi:hypothetical protein
MKETTRCCLYHAQLGKEMVMKKLLLAGFTAALFTAAGPAFAGPAEEAAQDFDGWRAAQRAMTSRQIIPNAEIVHASASVAALPRSRSFGGKAHPRPYR